MSSAGNFLFVLLPILVLSACDTPRREYYLEVDGKPYLHRSVVDAAVEKMLERSDNVSRDQVVFQLISMQLSALSLSELMLDTTDGFRRERKRFMRDQVLSMFRNDMILPQVIDKELVDNAIRNYRLQTEVQVLAKDFTSTDDRERVRSDILKLRAEADLSDKRLVDFSSFVRRHSDRKELRPMVVRYGSGPLQFERDVYSTQQGGLTQVHELKGVFIFAKVGETKPLPKSWEDRTPSEFRMRALLKERYILESTDDVIHRERRVLDSLWALNEVAIDSTAVYASVDSSSPNQAVALARIGGSMVLLQDVVDLKDSSDFWNSRRLIRELERVIHFRLLMNAFGKELVSSPHFMASYLTFSETYFGDRIESVGRPEKDYLAGAFELMSEEVEIPARVIYDEIAVINPRAYNPNWLNEGASLEEIRSLLTRSYPSDFVVIAGKRYSENERSRLGKQALTLRLNVPEIIWNPDSSFSVIQVKMKENRSQKTRSATEALLKRTTYRRQRLINAYHQSFLRNHKVVRYALD